MAILLGRDFAPSAGERNTIRPGRNRFKRTGSWQSGKEPSLFLHLLQQGDFTKYLSHLLFSSSVSVSSQVLKSDVSIRNGNVPFDAKMNIYDVLI